LGGNTAGEETTGKKIDDTMSAPGRPTLSGSAPTITTCVVTYSFSSADKVTDVKIEGKAASTGQWKTIKTLSDDSGSYSVSPYRDYILPAEYKDSTFGEIGSCVWIRVSGKNSEGWGSARSIFFVFDTGGCSKDSV
jgi:hypothetical protein